MGLMEVASGKSVYRGYEYYIHNKVLFAEKVDDYQYRGAITKSTGGRMCAISARCRWAGGCYPASATS